MSGPGAPSAATQEPRGQPDAHPWVTLCMTTAIQALVSMAALAMPVLAALIGPTVRMASHQRNLVRNVPIKGTQPFARLVGGCEHN